MSNVTEISDSNRHLLILDNFTVIKFYTPWCGPCKSYAKTFDAVSSIPEFADRVSFVSVDVDLYRQESDTLGIRSVPSTVFKVGGKHDVVSGVMSLGALESRIKQYLT